MPHDITRIEAVARKMNNAHLGASRFQITAYSGPRFRDFRRQLMSVATGERFPIKYGVNHLRHELYRLAGIEGGCLAEREERFTTYCAELLGIMDPGEERRAARRAVIAKLDQEPAVA